MRGQRSRRMGEHMSWVGIAATMLLAASACGGSLSEEEAREEFDMAVRQANACRTVDDCVLVMPGCPLGCWAAVSSGAEAQIEETAAELIAEHNSDGTGCAYRCPASPAIQCVENACALNQ